MKKLSMLTFAFVSTAVLVSAAYSASIPNTDNPRTFLGPTARIDFTSTMDNDSAYSVAGEAGVKNFRVGGTLGWKCGQYQRFKVSAEYLWQDITYAFFSGNTDQWVHQGAIGAAYQYDLADNQYRPQLDISAYGSHAPSKNLSTVTGTYMNASGTTVPFANARRIAGSNGGGAAPGLAMMPWEGGRLSVAANYDHVRYDTKYLAEDENAYGWGGTATLDQALTDSIGIGLSAAVRKPFNNYAANISWSDVPFMGSWTLALYGEYNAGKTELPDTYNVGLSADYFLDRRSEAVPANLKGERNLKGEVPMTRPVSDNLLAWTADPAVYMPQVLAIADSSFQIQCSGPIKYIGPTNPATLPPFDGFPESPFTFNFGPLFKGTPILYSLHVTVSPSTPEGHPSDFSINPQTGVLSYNVTDVGGAYTITVTGTNSCGKASVTFDWDNT